MILSNREKILMLAVFIVMVVYGFNLMFMEPLRQQDKANQTRIEILKDKIKAARTEKNLQGGRTAQAAALSRTDKELDQVIPNRSDSWQVLTTVYLLAAENHLKLVQVGEVWDAESTGKSPVHPLKSYRLALEIRGSYQDMKTFLSAIEKVPHVTVTDISIDMPIEEPNQIKDQALVGLIGKSSYNPDAAVAKLTLRVYYDD